MRRVINLRCLVWRAAAISLVGLLLAGCMSGKAVDFNQTLAAADRSAADIERDLRSRPVEVLEFLELQPGMRVADIFTGGGYYGEVLSHAVGATGLVVAHNNAAYANFAGDAPVKRFGDNRLSNSRYLVTEADDLQLPNNLDLILMVMSYHDVYWVNEQQGWPAIDTAAFDAQLYAALRPGGSLAIIDHHAAEGTKADAVAPLHRIDRDFVVRRLEAAGFRLAEESQMFRNEADDRSLLVFDPKIRGKTDRFFLRFERK